jgi:hypothetical protein
MSEIVFQRNFLDSVGVTWSVREISSPSLSGALAKLLENDRRRGGWLVFESDEGEKRRLTPYPPDWRTMTAFEIERWCMRATRVPPAPARRAED